MKIQKTHDRKTKNNHYRRYFADDGLVLWYVHVNKREITGVIKRVYEDLKEEKCTEKGVPIADLPQSVFDFIVNDLDTNKK